MDKEKVRELKLKMEFNPGQEKYEPVLPLRKAGRKDKVKLNLKELLILVLILAIALSPFIFWYFALK